MKVAARQVRESEEKSLSHELWDWTKSILVALLVVILMHKFGFNLSMVQGSSMQPTLREGEWLFVNKAVMYVRDPLRGEVVILKEPVPEQMEEHPFLVKRVVAVAGDEVQGKDGLLYVNGAPITEQYTDTAISDGDFGPLRVAEGTVFVMGDNRHVRASSDSRVFGAVPVDSVEGRAEWVLWPYSAITDL